MHGTPLPHKSARVQLGNFLDPKRGAAGVADPTDGNWWLANGYVDLIPIVPHDAELSENSYIRKNHSRGKVPGIRYPSGLWGGLPGWSRHVATALDIEDWRAMGAGIGLRRGAAFALDIDATDETIADAIEAAALAQLGPAPMRVGRWPKRALLYRADGPISGGKLLFFEGPGGAVNQIEVPPQAVVSGIHPGTGKPYEWRRLPVPLAELTPVDQSKLDAFVDSQRLVLPAARAARPVRSTKAPDGPFSPAEAVARAVFLERDKWAADVLPVDATQGDWRISSRELDRDLEEDLCVFADGQGAYDFGTERNHTAVSLIREFGAIVGGEIVFGGCPIYGPKGVEQYAVVGEATDVRRPTEAEALTWLCGRLAGCDWPAFPEGATWSNSIRTVSQAVGLNWEALRRTDCLMKWFEPKIEPEGWRADEIARYADFLPAMRSLDPKGFARFEFVWDLNGATGGRSVAITKEGLLNATPFVWRDPSQIPPRQWIYGGHYIRGYVTATVAPGGTGKTAFTQTEGIAIATGRKLLRSSPKQALRVWLFNLEDPAEEIERRIAAAVIHHQVDPDLLSGQLFINSGRDTPLVMAKRLKDSVTVLEPTVDALVAEIKARRIDVLIIDPFVSSHELPENDNVAINMAVKAWGRVAGRTNCSIELVHHARKLGGNNISAEDARGGSAFVDGCRAVRVVSRMTDDEASRLGIAEPRRFFYVVSDKQNMAPPADKREWFRLASVAISNGDNVGAVETWDLPDPLSGVSDDERQAIQTAFRSGHYRENQQASDWGGFVVAKVLGLDAGEGCKPASLTADQKAARARVRAVLQTWLANGALRVEMRVDPKRRDERPFLTAPEEDSA